MALHFALILFSCLAFAAAPTVKSPAGPFEGIETAQGRQFFGIPYALPPVGKLRFAPPQEIPAKHAKASAQKFGSPCVQPDAHHIAPTAGEKTKGSEDCLFLNVYAPRTSKKNLPVLVWIHGGGLVIGSSHEYDGHLLAEKNNAIVVTLNYRLGALGFLAHEALGGNAENLGIQDQQMALRWVQKNIAAFGGNPRDVAIFGESAGAQSVCAQLLSPSAKGLFARAISESGPCGQNLMQEQAAAEAQGREIAKMAGCPGKGAAALECLRKVPAEMLATLSAGASDLQVTPWKLTTGTPVLPEGPAAFAKGIFTQVPVILGTNRDEGRLFASVALAKGRLRDAADFEKEMKETFGANGSKVAEQYPVKNYATPALAFAAVNTDWLFACPSFAAVKAIAAYTTAYAYEFDDEKAPVDLPPNPQLPTGYGAFHTSELQYVFGTKWSFTNPDHFSPDQKKLADEMQSDWVNFTKSGEPSLSSDPWPKMSAAQPKVRRLAPEGPTLEDDFSSFHHCEFWAMFGK